MRLVLPFTCCAAVLAALPSLPCTVPLQTGFEGVIVFTMRPAEGKLRVVFQTTKGRKVRFDNLGGDRNPWIVDADAGRIMAISHKERKVFVMGSVLEQLQEQLRHADRRA